MESNPHSMRNPRVPDFVLDTNHRKRSAFPRCHRTDKEQGHPRSSPQRPRIWEPIHHQREGASQRIILPPYYYTGARLRGERPRATAKPTPQGTGSVTIVTARKSRGSEAPALRGDPERLMSKFTSLRTGEFLFAAPIRAGMIIPDRQCGGN